MPSDTAVVLPFSGSDDAAQKGKLGWRGGGRWRPLWHGGGFINVSLWIDDDSDTCTNHLGGGGILFMSILQAYVVS